MSDRQMEYALAAIALTDPRTVRRCLEGKRVSALARERIEKAVRALESLPRAVEPSPPNEHVMASFAAALRAAGLLQQQGADAEREE